MKVLYIAGSGRSGSTILDNILGQVPGVVSVGEARYLWQRGVLDGRTCGCGEPVRACPLWGPILEELGEGDPEGLARRMVALQRRGLRARHALPMLRPGGTDAARQRLGEYPQILDRLYRRIAERSEAEVIVDSSKLPTYGVALGLAPSVDLHVLHLVRDPRAAAYSWMRRKALPDAPGLMQRQRPLKSTWLWTMWNLMTGALWSRRPDRYLRLRYEDFVAAPLETVERVLRFVGRSPADAPFVDGTTVQLQPTHSVAGNPSRFKTGLVPIRRDDEWIERLSDRDRRVATAVGLPLLVRYGYPIGPPRDRG